MAATQTQPMTILLAEDNHADVYMVKTSLREHKIAHELLVFSDGEEAFLFIENIQSGSAAPSLVLLDLNLPKRSGHEILKRLRTNPHCMTVPVIVMTSSDSPADRAQATALGARAYFRKPMQLDQFMQLGGVVKQVIEDSGASASA